MDVMVDNEQPLILSDGSSNRNTPERCPRPLYSGDYTQKRQKILRCYQYKKFKHVKPEAQVGAEEQYVWIDEPCEEKEIPPEISTDSGDSKDTQTDIQAVEEEEEDMKIHEDKNVPEISVDPGDTQRDVKAEAEGKQVMTESKLLEIGIDGRYRWYNMEKHPIECHNGEIVEDNITASVAEENVVTPNLHQASYKEEKSFSCMDCGKRFASESYLIMHHRSHIGEKPFGCPECGKRFMYKWSLTQHLATHTTRMAYLCPHCGVRFRTEWILLEHLKIHSSKGTQR